LTPEVLKKKHGIHVQIWSFKFFGFDRVRASQYSAFLANLDDEKFLGEHFLTWEDVNNMCYKPRQSVSLVPRAWLKQQDDDDKSVSGTLSFRLAFRKTEESDFQGPTKNVTGWSV